MENSENRTVSRNKWGWTACRPSSSGGLFAPRWVFVCVETEPDRERGALMKKSSRKRKGLDRESDRHRNAGLNSPHHFHKRIRSVRLFFFFLQSAVLDSRSGFDSSLPRLVPATAASVIHHRFLFFNRRLLLDCFCGPQPSTFEFRGQLCGRTES